MKMIARQHQRIPVGIGGAMIKIPKKMMTRHVRGASFRYTSNLTQCSCRRWDEATFKRHDFGFRLVLGVR